MIVKSLNSSLNKDFVNYRLSLIAENLNNIINISAIIFCRFVLNYKNFM